jgi:alanyl-tRNA synthetase
MIQNIAMDSKEIRRHFLEFFRSKGHEIVPSAPMVVKNDPTLMFTNSGMAPFKDLFLGNAPIVHPRVADTQKCLRVSGKHNDLEEVGVDTYHHTMFEMLGNWSFGDYFKKEAIAWAWELLTEVYKIDKSRLYVTVFEGAAEEGLGFDQEAFDTWKQYIAEDRILNGNKKDNFWEMGDVGPCGPCSEIHYDGRSDEERRSVSGASLVNKDHPQVIEIWNNVFMEFERKADGTLVKLPKQHVDTGMGLERLVRVLQGKQSNYDTDLFTPIIFQTQVYCGKIYGNDEKADIAFRVVADHLRAVSMSIADGQLPSNTGAGYVIRRILRRAIRYGFSVLEMKEAFIYKLVPVLVDVLGETFPELAKQSDFIQKVIREEEMSFLRTIGNGLTRLMDLIRNSDSKTLDGVYVFELYDTFGFPPDLTRLIASEEGFTIDEEGFSKALLEQKNRSRKASELKTGDWVEVHPYTKPEFVGYDVLETESKILKFRLVQAKGKDLYQIVLDKTPFYAESGGQVGDTGVLENIHEKVHIIDTIKENDLIIHLTSKMPESLQQSFTARVDEHRRMLTANNHSATHLLHAALRQVLGNHVEQRGSLVNPDYLRFDFSHSGKITNEELQKIEAIVNERIRSNIACGENRNVPLEKAREMGAMALFGEKYGAEVRVITFDPAYSIELCGGTHVKSTGQIGFFKIISEGSIASGIRRIEAITASRAEDYVNEQLQLLQDIKNMLKSAANPLKQIEHLQESNIALQKQIEKYKIQEAALKKEELLKEANFINGIRFIGTRVQLEADMIKNIAFEWHKNEKALVALLATQQGDKVGLSLIVSADLVEKGMNAVAMLKTLAVHINGGGGGQAFFATAGGKNPDGIDKAIAEAMKMLELAS